MNPKTTQRDALHQARAALAAARDYHHAPREPEEPEDDETPEERADHLQTLCAQHKYFDRILAYSISAPARWYAARQTDRLRAEIKELRRKD